jgi:hypothetical protein
MRMILKIKIPPESGNRAAQDGSMMKVFQSLHERLKPEATYLSMDDGMTCAYVIYEPNEEVQFLEIHEPLSRTIGALVYDYPALTWEDMVRGWEQS